MKSIAVLLSVVLFAFAAQANIKTNTIYNGRTGATVTLDQVLDQVTPGTVIFMGEYHGYTPHHNNQISVIQDLIDRGHTVSVGMEHIDYTRQSSVDNFLAGKVSEADFLTEIAWANGTPWASYREQVMLPLKSGGITRALNSPRWLTGDIIAKRGIKNLSDEDKLLLPPNFQEGGELYRERFVDAMGGHGGSTVDLYFTAQSVWDDTMAWQIIKHFEDRPDDVLVVIIGDFHVKYGGGFPARLRARGYYNYINISQESAGTGTQEELDEAISPHSAYGERGDYVWLMD